MVEAPQKISIEYIRIEKLSQAHQNLIKSFKSYEQELMDFLVEDAMDNQNKKISITYLWFLKSTNELTGYLTLLTDKISLNPSLKDEFKLRGVYYKSLPAVKIGRICVDDKFIGKGIGTLMIEFTIYLIKKISEECGCRFITIDAKRNPNKTKDSIHFYKRMGFEVLKHREKGTTPMYKDVFKIIENS